MAWTYEAVTPTPVANALVERGLSNGVHRIYRVTPNDGYVLHDTRLDMEVRDPDAGAPTGDIAPGYKAGTVSVAANYDFEAVTQATVQGVSGTSYVVDKVGVNEFYALPESEVPTAQIYSGNNHETA